MNRDILDIKHMLASFSEVNMWVDGNLAACSSIPEKESKSSSTCRRREGSRPRWKPDDGTGRHCVIWPATTESRDTRHGYL